MTPTPLVAKAVRLAQSPEWTAERAAWVLRSTTGANMVQAEQALDEICIDLRDDPKPDKALVRAADTLTVLVDELGRAKTTRGAFSV